MSSIFAAVAAPQRHRPNGCAAQHLRGRGRGVPGPGHCGHHLLPVSAPTLQGHEGAGQPLQDGDPGKYTHILSSFWILLGC